MVGAEGPPGTLGAPANDQQTEGYVWHLPTTTGTGGRWLVDQEFFLVLVTPPPLPKMEEKEVVRPCKTAPITLGVRGAEKLGVGSTDPQAIE